MHSSDPSIPPSRPVTVEDLAASAGLRGILSQQAGRQGNLRLLNHPRVQKGGLVLAGHLHGVVPTRVQVFGETELTFLQSLEENTQRSRLAAFFALEVSCLVVTRGADPGAVLTAGADESETPLFVSSKRSSHTIAEIHHALDRLLAPSMQVHGVFVDVYGIGVLLQGPSGVGKSECALALVKRGHRLVADDVILLHRKPSGDIEGEAPMPLRNHLEIRGLGILNIQDLFGATAVRRKKRVDLVVRLSPWEQGKPYDRLGFDDHTSEFLQANLPTVDIPVSAGRDMGLIVEVAARNQLRKVATDTGPRVEQRLSETLGLAREEPEPADDGTGDLRAVEEGVEP